jgi:hypothetical protein
MDTAVLSSSNIAVYQNNNNETKKEKETIVAIYLSIYRPTVRF